MRKRSNYAQKVKQTFEEAEKSGRGAIKLQGRMIDKPVYLKAVSLFA